jgi:hypothetical protein
MIMDDNIISSAARLGVRYAAVRGADSAHPATASTVQTFVVGVSSNLLTTSNVNVTWPSGNKVGSNVVVTTTYTFSPIVPLIPQTSRTLSSTATMVIIR